MARPMRRLAACGSDSGRSRGQDSSLGGPLVRGRRGPARRGLAREESQAEGLARVQSRAMRKTDLWHAAFHRVLHFNSATALPPWIPRAWIIPLGAAPLLCETWTAINRFHHKGTKNARGKFRQTAGVFQPPRKNPRKWDAAAAGERRPLAEFPSLFTVQSITPA